MKRNNTYDASSITILKGLEGVRRKPSMYVGAADTQGVSHLFKEIVGNCLDEATNGHGRDIAIDIYDNTITVWDSGRGIPVGKPRGSTEDVLTSVATKLHAGGKLDANDGNYETSLGCFTGDTKIKMLNTSKGIRIDELAEKFKQDETHFRVHGYDIGNFTPNIITECYGVFETKKVDEIAVVVLSNGKEIKCTLDHPFLTLSGKYVQAIDLHPDQKLQGYNRSFQVEIVYIKKLTEKVPVYGMSVKNTHNYLLDAGVYVSNTHGVGLAVVNALSSFMQIWTHRNGKIYTQTFSKGKPTSDVKQTTSAPKFDGKKWVHGGTVVQWKPDLSCFDKGSKLDIKEMISWVKDISWFVTSPNGAKRYPVKFHYTIGDRDAVVIERKSLKQYVINRVSKLPNVEIMEDTFMIDKTDRCDFVGAWTTSPLPLMDSACNSAPTTDGGTHLKGALKAMEDAFRKIAKKAQIFKSADLMSGFVGCFNIRVPSPRFDSQSKNRLTSPEAEKLAYDAVLDVASKWIRRNRESANTILERAVAIHNASTDIKLTKQLAAALKTNKNGKSMLPLGLLVSTTKVPEDRELFLLEGLSASGTARAASDRSFQEVLALRGKILNTERSTDKLTDSQAIVNILQSIGYNPKNPTGKLRVGRIMMLSDPDSDGQHINALCLTVLWKTVPHLFEEGKVFVVNAPLYVYSSPTQKVYGSTFADLSSKVKGKMDIANVTRVKGYAEMKSEDLADVAFDPNTRSLTKVIHPGANTLMVSQIMGDDATYRKKLLGLSK